MGFRVLKWAIAIGLVVYFEARAPHVWWWVAGALALGLIVHLSVADEDQGVDAALGRVERSRRDS